MNRLYYGDNLEILRKKIESNSIDLCYIDPPFNSKRNYNQIYAKDFKQDKAQAQAFVDTWEWDQMAEAGLAEILANDKGRFKPETIELMKGLRAVLGKESLLAYLVSMTLRVTEIWRVLKPTGTFYLHCDPTAGHYLKLLLDTIFGVEFFLNELIWCYNVGGKSDRHWARKHDTIFFYAKGKDWFFDGFAVGIKRETGTKSFGGIIGVDEEGRRYQDKLAKSSGKYYRYYLDDPKIPEDWWVGINSIQSQSAERLGYPTQKPRELLTRIIKASSKEGQTVLDAYCGCGTTVAVAQELNRKWIGIDITYQSISLVLKRLEDTFGSPTADAVAVDGIPKDMASAIALAHKKDDRVRKEFEKWAVLTYSNNRATINEKRGADQGVDGIAYFMETKTENQKVIFQAKSGNIGEKDIRDLLGAMEQEQAAIGIFITLQEPTRRMVKAAHSAGTYRHPLIGRTYDRIQIVTVKDIVENGARIQLPLMREVVKAAERRSRHVQATLPQAAETGTPYNADEDE